jgi:acyl carrier protein
MWLTGRHDVAFGAVVSGRPTEEAGAESMVGLLINTVPVRANITPATTTADLLYQLQSAHNDTLEHQHLGLSDIHRITGQERLFDTVFVYENYPSDAAALLGGAHDLVITESCIRDYYHYPLTIQAVPGRELELRVQYRTDVFDAESIEALIERFKGVLTAVTADPIRPLSLDLLDGAEHARLDGWGNRAVLEQPATTAVSAPQYRDTGGYGVPATLVEQILADMFAQVLGVDRVGIDESFFDLGGNSLSAMRAITAINAALDIHLAVTTLFDAPSVRSLSQQVADMPSLSDTFTVRPTSDSP